MDRSPEPGARAQDVGSSDIGQMVEGSSVVFLGGLVDKAARLFTLWFLSRALGATELGVYTLTITCVTLAQMLAPLGAENGALLFIARQAQGPDRAQLKGTLRTVLGLGSIGGLAITAVVLAIARFAPIDPEVARALPLAAAAITVGAPMLVMAGIVQARHRFRSYVTSIYLAVPLSILVGSLVGVRLGIGLEGALVANALGHVLGLALLAHAVWSDFGALLRDRSVVPAYGVRELLAYAIPQSLSKMLWQFNLWTDVLMIGWLATNADVGVYRVALSVAVFGTLPTMALTTAMNPRAAALVHQGERERLDRLLKVGTRVLLLLLAPCFMVIALLPDACLALFGAEYVSATPALLALVAGQTIYVLTGPTNSLLAMGGYARINLVNNLIGVGVNAGLNYVLIPRMGILGAALASVTAQTIWSAARATEVFWLLRCFPFDRRAGLALALGVGVVLAVIALTPLGSNARHVAAGLAVPTYLALLWKLASTDDEVAMLKAMTDRARRILAPGF